MSWNTDSRGPILLIETLAASINALAVEPMTALRALGIAAAVIFGLIATALALGLLRLLVSDECARAVLHGAALTAWGAACALALVAPRKIEQLHLRERLENQRFDGRDLDRLVAWTEELRREADVAKMAGETRKTEER